MKVLGLDTSHYVNMVGIVESGRVLADLTYEARSDSLVKVTANVDAALQRAGMKLSDVDGFGVGLGPGSWTGIRVAVTVGKMLAYATGKPVCGISTLEALAHQARRPGVLICPIVNAGTRETVYSALYRFEDSVFTRVDDYYVGSIMGLAARLQGPAIIVGAEADFYAEYLAVGIDLEVVKTLPFGKTMAALAAIRLERGEKDDTLSLTPLYLKESTARVFQGPK